MDYKTIDEAFEAGRQQGLKQERALWELSALTQEMEKDQQDKITIVKTEAGEVVAVTLTDEEHRINKVIWEKEDPESTKDEVELNLEVPMLYNLMLAAHQQDITLNQLVEKILKERIAKIEGTSPVL